ncbi:hypothetical protein NBO_27g0053 [Nosema bombycis CQ1]|uniref:Uncharacterized protein n=1 Tax=Nosema bombycis (strain CQ1 / CVCC 102059) TaxID=578461 RepID=R0MNR1_NOSB1|nr:hypothetical protein NBO_27g0053 [Nosema bombycis CQ1]|eukprot:EOB14498.1 hypothetical protein NBO_27g0053 [Nosema bombycis CQ1]
MIKKSVEKTDRPRFKGTFLYLLYNLLFKKTFFNKSTKSIKISILNYFLMIKFCFYLLNK